MPGQVLLTGSTGFIGSHVLDILVKYQYHIIAVVRNIDQGIYYKTKYPTANIAFIEVPDISQENSLDFIFKLNPDIRYVIHTVQPEVPCDLRNSLEQSTLSTLSAPHSSSCSICPYHSSLLDDHEKDRILFEPSIRTSHNIINAVDKYGLNVQSVVYSSCFASMISDSPRFNDPRKVYSARDFSKITREQARRSCYNSYIGSCTFAEDALWKRYSDIFPRFTLTVIVTPLVLGPIITSKLSETTATDTISNHSMNKNFSLYQAYKLLAGTPPQSPIKESSIELSHNSSPYFEINPMSIPKGKPTSIHGMLKPFNSSIPQSNNSPADSNPLPPPTNSQLARSVSTKSINALSRSVSRSAKLSRSSSTKLYSPTSTPANTPSPVLVTSENQKQQLPELAFPFYIDVRDAASAYIRAIQLVPPETDRWFVVANNISVQQIVDIARTRFPVICDRLPLGNPGQGDEVIAQQCSFDIRASKSTIGLHYRSLEDTVQSTFESFLQHEQAQLV